MQPAEADADADPAEWAEGELQPSSQTADSASSTPSLRTNQADADTADPAAQAAAGDAISSNTIERRECSEDAQSMDVDTTHKEGTSDVLAAAGADVCCNRWTLNACFALMHTLYNEQDFDSPLLSGDVLSDPIDIIGRMLLDPGPATRVMAGSLPQGSTGLSSCLATNNMSSESGVAVFQV